jgi:hypothetical protein
MNLPFLELSSAIFTNILLLLCPLLSDCTHLLCHSLRLAAHCQWKDGALLSIFGGHCAPLVCSLPSSVLQALPTTMWFTRLFYSRKIPKWGKWQTCHLPFEVMGQIFENQLSLSHCLLQMTSLEFLPSWCDPTTSSGCWNSATMWPGWRRWTRRSLGPRTSSFTRGCPNAGRAWTRGARCPQRRVARTSWWRCMPFRNTLYSGHYSKQYQSSHNIMTP